MSIPTDTLLPRLATIALLLASSAATCDSVCASNINWYASVKGFGLSLKNRQHFGVGVRQHLFSTTTTDAIICRGSHFSSTVYGVRGGADNTHDNDNDIDDEMRRLRKKWSDIIPATPSIAWPVSDTMVLGDDSTETTLGNRDGRVKALIIMDGFSPYHGQYIAHAARQNYGTAVIHVFSDFMTRYLSEVEGQKDHLSSRLPDLENVDDVNAWSSLLPPSMEICGIYCESDSGLEDSERLGVALGLKCHDGVNYARRDKFLMNKVVSEVGGLDVVKQKSCCTVEEAEDFAIELGLGEDVTDDGRRVVVKPLRGVASDDVHLCSTLPALRKAFHKILYSPVFGSPKEAKHEQVLVQEFAAGIEYAVDVVCRNGERKVAALWRYDKRAVNDAPFVYLCTELVSSISKEGVEQEVCKYVFKALEALGVRWGLSHVEVIVGTSNTGKVQIRLVEVNCRQHNTDFMPLANACIGYNALDMVLAAYLGDAETEKTSSTSRGPRWESIPSLPTTHAHGAIVHFVSHVEGSISRIRFDVLEEIEDLPSVMDLHVYPQFMEVGNSIAKTIDIRSDTGWAHIMNDDEDEFRRDYSRIVELMKEMFEVEESN